MARAWNQTNCRNSWYVLNVNEIKMKRIFFFNQLEDENVHKMLREFKDRHYCAKDMTLAIQSQNELDTLQVEFWSPTYDF